MRERLHRHFSGRIIRHPRDELSEAIARVSLELQRLGILLLPSRALQVDDHLTRGGKRRLRTEVFFDERQREIDPGGDTGGGVEVAILDEERVCINPQLRKSLGYVRGEAPMRRDAAAIEQVR